MKKIIILFAISCAFFQAKAQTDTTYTESNPYFSAVKQIDWKEMGWQLSEYSYGFLNQGVKTIEGTYETIKELPSAIAQIGDLDFIDFGSFLAKSVYDGVTNTVKDFVSGDPEKAGAAAFDLVLFIDGGKQAVKTGIKGIQGVKDVASSKTYHYTDKAAGANINKNGLLTPSSRGVVTTPENNYSYTTNKAYLTGDEAINDLALDRQYGTVDTRVTIIKDEKWVPDVVQDVEPKFGKPGGGIEEKRNVDIPATAIYDVSEISQKPVMLINDYVITPMGKSADLIQSSIITSSISQNLIDNSTEGGHNLVGRVSVVIIIDDSVKQGGFKFFNKDDTKFVFINSDDIYRLTPDFISCLSGSTSVLPVNQSIRERADVIPDVRNSRGL